MVYRFLEKDERPKPTIAMDYSFGRKTVKSLVSLDARESGEYAHALSHTYIHQNDRIIIEFTYIYILYTRTHIYTCCLFELANHGR